MSDEQINSLVLTWSESKRLGDAAIREVMLLTNLLDARIKCYFILSRPSLSRKL